MNRRMAAVLIFLITVLGSLVCIAFPKDGRYKDFVLYREGDRLRIAALNQKGVVLLKADGGRILKDRYGLRGSFGSLEVLYAGGRPRIAAIGGKGIVVAHPEGTNAEERRLIDNGLVIDTILYPGNTDPEMIIVVSGDGELWYGDRITGYRIEKGYRQVFSMDASIYGPWRLWTADVDGDGQREVSVGVYKASPLHPVMAKRPFIYDWDGDHLRPKWLGSRLSRPFSDYVFADLNRDGTDEIIALEMLQDESCAVHAYEWNGFGFTALAQSDASDLYEGIGVSDIDGDGRTGIHVKFKQGQHTGFRIIAYNGEKLETLHTILCKDPGKIDILDGIAVYSSRGRIYATELPDMGI